MTEQAPVCHIPPIVPSEQPQPLNLPSIAPAQPNLQSLTRTVNQMRQVIMLLAGQQGLRGATGKPGNNAKAKPARWTEQSRQTETVRVYNKDDKSQYVDIERINNLSMKDGITGDSWTWSRNR